MTQVPLLNDDLLTGRDDSFIDHEHLQRPVHRAMVNAWQALVVDARAAGFEPAIVSGFRNYQRQLLIWNAKANGERVLLDSAGVPLDPSGLDEWQLVQAILRWSALPGASRHHWGTDIDVYDCAAVDDTYTVQLTPDEVCRRRSVRSFSPLAGSSVLIATKATVFSVLMPARPAVSRRSAGI